MYAFMLSGLLAAVAGLLYAGRQGSVNNSMGDGMVLLAFAGAILGGASLEGGKGTPLGMLGGGILLGMISNSLNLLGVGVTLVYATKGALIFLAIVLDQVKVKLRNHLLHKEQVEKLLHQSREKDGDPAGVVIEISGSVEDMFAQACTRGFNSVIEQYPQLTVARAEGHWNNVDSHERTSDLLTRHGADVLGIYVHTPDIMGPGAVSAIEAAGLDPADYGIAGICMGPEGVALIKEGKILAIVAQPAMVSAELAVEYLYNLNKGLPIPQIGDVVEEEGALWSPAEVIKNPWADEGGFMVLQGPLVPFDVEPDDPRLWENRLSHLW